MKFGMHIIRRLGTETSNISMPHVQALQNQICGTLQWYMYNRCSMQTHVLLHSGKVGEGGDGSV